MSAGEYPLFCSIVISFVLISLTSVLILRRRRGIKLPPGPWRLPLIGNMHQLFGMSIHRSLRDMGARIGPLMYLELGQISVLVVSSPEATSEIMSTHDALFSSRTLSLSMRIISYDAKDLGFSPYGHYWRQLRKICTLHLLSSKSVLLFRPLREQEVSAFISSIRLMIGSPFNFQQQISSMIFGMNSRIIFGKKHKGRERYVAVVEEQIKLGSMFSFLDFFPSLSFLHKLSRTLSNIHKLHKEADRFLQNVLNEHREARSTNQRVGDDLVTLLLSIQENNDFQLILEDYNVKAILQNIFVAASDTSASTIEWAMTEMMNNQKVMENAQREVRCAFQGKSGVDEDGIRELVYLKAVIKETLRLHPTAPLIPRENTESCEVMGYVIPANTKVYVNAWAIGRHPLYWKDAELFNPARFLNTDINLVGNNFEYLPFGGGRRICPGVQFANIAMELILAQLLYHFDWKLPQGEAEIDMEDALGILLRKRKALVLVPFPHAT